MNAGAAMPLVAASADDLAPVGLALLDLLVEIRIEQQVHQARFLRVGVGDLLEEAGADDAAAAPDAGDRREIELPVVFLLGLAHELEALGVGADLRAVERVADRVDQLVAVACMACGVRALEDACWRRRALP